MGKYEQKTDGRTSRIAVCQWCLPVEGPQGLIQAADLGYDGVEMDMGFNKQEYDLRNPSILEQFLEAKFVSGILTPSLALNYFCLNCLEKKEETRETLDRVLEVAAKLEAGTLQLCSFWEEGMRNEKEFSATVENLKYACRHAKKLGITIASENQLSIDGNRELLEAVSDDNFGIYFDTANPYLFDGRDGIVMLEALFPFISELHIKDYELDGEKKCVPLGKGQCHTEEAAGILRQRKYDKWVVIENQLSAMELADDAEYIRKALI